MLPQKIFNFRASEIAISSVFRGNLKWFNCYEVISTFTFFLTTRFYVQFRGLDRTTRTTPRSAPAFPEGTSVTMSFSGEWQPAGMCLGIPHWTTLQEVNDTRYEVIHCWCKTVCSRRCKCVKGNLAWTGLCNCREQLLLGLPFRNK